MGDTTSTECILSTHGGIQDGMKQSWVFLHFFISNKDIAVHTTATVVKPSSLNTSQKILMIGLCIFN